MSGFVMIPKDLLKKIDDVDSNIIAIYTYLSIKADHEEIEYRGLTLEQGEWLTSIRKIAQKLKITANEVRKGVRILIRNGFISVSSTCDKLGTIFIICEMKRKVTRKKVVSNSQESGKKVVSKSNSFTEDYDTPQKVTRKKVVSNSQESGKKVVRQINNTKTNTNTKTNNNTTTTRACEEKFENGEFNEQFFENFRNFVNSEIDKSNSKIKKMQVQSAGGRANKIIRLIGLFGKEKVAEGIRRAVKSPYLNGGCNMRTPATIDWILTEENFIKIIEGNYDENYNTKRNGNDIRDIKRRIGQTDDYGESTITL